MYCVKCGKEFMRGECFCSNCGTKVVSSESKGTFDISKTELKEKTMEMKDNFMSGINDLGNTKIMFFSQIICLLLSMLFADTKIIKVSGWLDISQSVSMFDGSEGIKIVVYFCYVLSIFFLIKPLLIKKTWKTSSFLCSKIITIIMLVFFLLGIITGLDEINSSGYSDMVELSITTTGWLFVIVTVGALILSFKMSLDAKKREIIGLHVENDNQDTGV